MVISTMQNGDQDTRFINLLQPIRDLTKNWDVDIAGNLKEYLDELEKVTVTFDGGLTKMNFSEAAMIIQGSACVYSRKVEFLYSLVYQVLDLLANKNKKQGKSSVDKEGNDEDAEFNEEADEEFLSLDDIPEHRNILIKEDELGCKSVLPIPQIPLSLIPLEQGEKGDSPLLSKKGEVLASRNDFRMNTASVHNSGVLLLDMSHLGLLNKSLQFSTGQDTDRLETPVPEDAMPPQMDDDNDADNFMDLPENDDEGGNSVMPTDEVDEVPAEADGLPPAEHVMEEVGQDLRKSSRNIRREVIADRIPRVDPWQPVDPHEVDSAKEKPCKKKKTYKIPEWIEKDMASTKKRKRKRTENHTLAPLMEFFTKTLSCREGFPKNPMKVTAAAEFDQLFWREFKRRQSILSKKKKVLRHEIVEELEEEEEPQNDYDNNIEAGVNVDDGNFDDDVEDDHDIPLVNENLFDAIENAMSDNCGKFSSHVSENKTVLQDYEELVRQHVEQYMSSAQEYANVTELSQRVTEWENKVLPRLQEEEEHEPFDIKTYGGKVIDNLNRGNTTAFRNIAVNKPPFEICRIFLASLMLANTVNVEICNREGVDMFDLRLLSTTRHFEQLEEYQAPSATAKT